MTERRAVDCIREVVQQAGMTDIKYKEGMMSEFSDFSCDQCRRQEPIASRTVARKLIGDMTNITRGGSRLDQAAPGVLVAGLSGQPSTEELAVLEERMNSHQAEYRTDIARLAEDMVKRVAEAAKRETRMLLAVAGLISFGVVILGILIRWPG